MPFAKGRNDSRNELTSTLHILTTFSFLLLHALLVFIMHLAITASLEAALTDNVDSSKACREECLCETAILSHGRFCSPRCRQHENRPLSVKSFVLIHR